MVPRFVVELARKDRYLLSLECWIAFKRDSCQDRQKLQSGLAFLVPGAGPHCAVATKAQLRVCLKQQQAWQGPGSSGPGAETPRNARRCRCCVGLEYSPEALQAWGEHYCGLHYEVQL